MLAFSGDMEDALSLVDAIHLPECKPALRKHTHPGRTTTSEQMINSFNSVSYFIISNCGLCSSLSKQVSSLATFCLVVNSV